MTKPSGGGPATSPRGGGGDTEPARILDPVRIPEDSYQAARAEILHRFQGWRPDRAIHHYADLALDYKYYYVDGEYLRWTVGDVEDLLLAWVPRKVLLPDGMYGELAAGIRDFLRFLAASGQLADGSDPVDDLVGAVGANAAEMARRAVDPAHFGMAKATVAGDGPGGGGAMPLPPRPDADPAEAARVAAASRAYRRLCLLHDYFAEPRALTAKGNLRLADARHLVDALETGDRMDEVIGDRRFTTKSSAELVRLVSIVGFAREVGVVRVHAGKLVAVKRWQRSRDDPLEVVCRLADTMIDRGILAYYPMWPRVEAEVYVLEAAVPAVLAGLYDAPMAHEHILEAMVETVRTAVVLDEVGRRILDRSVETWMGWILDALEDLGLVTWEGFDLVDEYGRERRVGGVLALTVLGAYWCQNRLGSYGYTDPAEPPAAVTLADGPEAVVAALAVRLDVDVDELIWAVMELGGPDEVAAAVVSPF